MTLYADPDLVKRADYGNRRVLIGQWWSTNPGVVQRWETGFTDQATNHVEFETRGGHLCGRFGRLSKPGALVARK